MKLNLIAKILTIIYIAFITLFAFDIPNFLAILIQLIPSTILIAALITAWFKPKIGSILFIIIGIITIFFFNTYQGAFTFLTISIVPMAIGILFWFGEKH